MEVNTASSHIVQHVYLTPLKAQADHLIVNMVTRKGNKVMACNETF